MDVEELVSCRLPRHLPAGLLILACTCTPHKRLWKGSCGCPGASSCGHKQPVLACMAPACHQADQPLSLCGSSGQLAQHQSLSCSWRAAAVVGLVCCDAWSI